MNEHQENPPAYNFGNMLDAVSQIAVEIGDAEKLHPNWPDHDLFHEALILAEEAGEAMKATLDYYHGKGTLEDLRKEVKQTGAMAARFLASLLAREE